jgi:hypothetical protein
MRNLFSSQYQMCFLLFHTLSESYTSNQGFHKQSENIRVKSGERARSLYNSEAATDTLQNYVPETDGKFGVKRIFICATVPTLALISEHHCLLPGRDMATTDGIFPRIPWHTYHSGILHEHLDQMENILQYVRSEAVTVADVKSIIFWDIAPFSPHRESTDNYAATCSSEMSTDIRSYIPGGTTAFTIRCDKYYRTCKENKCWRGGDILGNIIIYANNTFTFVT